MSRTLIEVAGLAKRYPVERGIFRRAKEHVHAVDGVDLTIAQGESVGLVGESGCGKTTTGRMLVRLSKPTEGRVLLSDGDGNQVDIAHIARGEMRRFRRRVQMIFQDPYESMNPRRTVYDTVSEPLKVQGIGSLRTRQQTVAELLAKVGLTPPAAYMFRYPHELSGGQRQRVAIARALVLSPSFVVADEPTSMLDVSIRISIMDLMLELAREFDVAYLYITHDLAVARYMCERIAVMYVGKIVEIGPTEEVLANPLHPYTRALIAAVPVPDPEYVQPEVEIKGGVSKPIDPPPVCRFVDRCPWADEISRTNPHPPLEELRPNHFVACYHAREHAGS